MSDHRSVSSRQLGRQQQMPDSQRFSSNIVHEHTCHWLNQCRSMNIHEWLEVLYKPEWAAGEAVLLARQTPKLSDHLHSIARLTRVYKVIVSEYIHGPRQLTGRRLLWHLLQHVIRRQHWYLTNTRYTTTHIHQMVLVTHDAHGLFLDRRQRLWSHEWKI